MENLCLYKMYQHHIANGASGYGDQHLALPDMQTAGHQNGDQLRDAVASMKDTDIFQAVDDQHAKDGRRKIFSKILDEVWCFAVFVKNKKRQKTGGHRAKNT